MGLGDKAAALALSERAIAKSDREGRLNWSHPLEILARVAARTESPTRAIAALQKLLSIPYAGVAGNIPLILRAPARSDVRSAPNDPRFEKLVASAAPKTAGK